MVDCIECVLLIQLRSNRTVAMESNCIVIRAWMQEPFICMIKHHFVYRWNSCSLSLSSIISFPLKSEEYRKQSSSEHILSKHQYLIHDLTVGLVSQERQITDVSNMFVQFRLPFGHKTFLLLSWDVSLFGTLRR